MNDFQTLLSTAALVVALVHAVQGARHFRRRQAYLNSPDGTEPLLEAQAQAWHKKQYPLNPNTPDRWSQQQKQQFAAEIIAVHSALLALTNTAVTSAAAVLLKRILAGPMNMDPTLAAITAATLLVLTTTYTFKRPSKTDAWAASLSMTVTGTPWRKPEDRDKYEG